MKISIRFWVICHSLFRMRNVSDKSYEENKNTHFVFTIPPPPRPENRAVSEIMRKNSVESDWSQMTIWRVRFESRITKATNTHREYVILIAFPLQQWLHERI